MYYMYLLFIYKVDYIFSVTNNKLKTIKPKQMHIQCRGYSKVIV